MSKANFNILVKKLRDAGMVQEVDNLLGYRDLFNPNIRGINKLTKGPINAAQKEKYDNERQRRAILLDYENKLPGINRDEDKEFELIKEEGQEENYIIYRQGVEFNTFKDLIQILNRYRDCILKIEGYAKVDNFDTYVKVGSILLHRDTRTIRHINIPILMYVLNGNSDITEVSQFKIYQFEHSNRMKEFIGKDISYVNKQKKKFIIKMYLIF